jgi:tetraacyldisaccharide 4'-kinase
MELKNLETYYLDVITGKRTGFLPSILKIVLHPISWIFQFFVILRNWAFDHGWLRRYSPPVPVVISIGNIVAGGTGKTPLTCLLAKEFYDSVSIAILTRGYRSKAESLAVPIVLSRGQGPMHPASFCGDEPYMISQNFPKAFIFVGKDRHKSSDMAAKVGVKLILLDDAMQHRRLARDFEIVVMDAGDPFGQGYFLPRGLLREGMRALARADLIVLNHIYDHERFVNMRQKIGSYTTAPVVATKTEVSRILDLSGRPIESLQGKSVGIFCGIAHPEYFQDTVKRQGALIVASYSIPDHMEYNFDTLAEFAKNCKGKGAEMLLCTEKDRVKIVEALQLAIPIAWIQMQLVFVEGEAQWRTFVNGIKANLDRSF